MTISKNEQAILDLTRQGIQTKLIAQHLGCNRTTVQKTRKRYGIPSKFKRGNQPGLYRKQPQPIITLDNTPKPEKYIKDPDNTPKPEIYIKDPDLPSKDVTPTIQPKSVSPVKENSILDPHILSSLQKRDQLMHAFRQRQAMSTEK